MAYVPGFRYDLFFSYASRDRDARMAKFFEDVRDGISGELGPLFNDECVFVDREKLHQAPLDWKNELERSVESAAILVPFISPNSVGSAVCAEEWDWFCDDPVLTWPVGTGGENVYRVCPVRWRDVDEELWRQVDKRIRVAQEHRSLVVKDLGKMIANGLRLMRRTRTQVFVGETDSDVRQTVWDEMSKKGFRVTPEAPSAYADEEVIRKFLGEARLAVHFMGGQVRQRSLDAIAWSLKDCPGATIVYQAPGRKLTEPERLWLAHIAKGEPAVSRDSHVSPALTGSKEQLLEALREPLEGIQSVPATKLGIACEEVDAAAVKAIIPEISERTRFSVTCHVMSPLTLKRSRGLLFYWGKADGAWLRAARPLAEGKPTAFFLAPPRKTAGHLKQLGNTLILRQKKTAFCVDDLDPFLRLLGWTG